MQLFYNQYIQKKDTFFIFNKEESRHIVKVLRKKEGDIIFITNGQGFLFQSKINIASDKKCEVKITTVKQLSESKYNLHIAIAPTKMNERMEWFLEKATEIGIHEITPIISENSERKIYKIERGQRIIQAAMKQSLQYYLPQINEPISVQNFITNTKAKNKLIAHCADSERKLLKNCINPNENYVILIGPEGDFSSKEINLAIQNGFQPVLLGNTRLRTETAGVVACHTVALANE